MATINVSTAANADDGHSYAAFNNTDTTLSFGKVGGASDSRVFMRFLSVPVPKGAIIQSAYLTLVQKQNWCAANKKFIIKGNDIDTAVAPTSVAENNALVATTATVQMQPANAFVAGTDEVSPDIKTIIKEIVDRAGWASGNNMQLMADNVDGDNVWEYAAYDHASYNPPKLTISYFAGGPMIFAND